MSDGKTLFIPNTICECHMRSPFHKMDIVEPWTRDKEQEGRINQKHTR